MNRMMTTDQAAQKIADGRQLSIAGTLAALLALPKGQWVGGSIPYFMGEDGGMVADDHQVFVTDLTGVGEVTIATYTAADIHQVTERTPDNGLALLILPMGSDTHRRFAAEAANFKDAFLKPTVGWIAGVHLDDIGKKKAVVIDGRTGELYEDRGVAQHVRLPADKLVQVDIINLFAPEEGDVIQFDETSFSVETCLINGERTQFSDYVRRRGLEHGGLPLVGDFAGAHINASLQHVHDDRVDLYAPVFPGVTYHFARPVADYAAAFGERMAHQPVDGLAFSCNCILNYVFGDLHGKQIAGPRGPFTFGEIAYQLINQTQMTVRLL